jgi:hypothetical protein
MSDSEKKSIVPSELRLSLKWQQTFERFAVNTSIGAVACGLASVILFRSPFLRFGFTTFGAGFGAGDAFRVSNIEFEKEKK